MLSECCSAPIYGEITGTGPDACGICSECKEWAGVYDESMQPCPACGVPNDDDYPITINGKIESGCVACWEKECDKEWWEMVEKLYATKGMKMYCTIHERQYQNGKCPLCTKKKKKISAKILRTELSCAVSCMVDHDYGMARKMIEQVLARVDEYLLTS